MHNTLTIPKNEKLSHVFSTAVANFKYLLSRYSKMQPSLDDYWVRVYYNNDVPSYGYLCLAGAFALMNSDIRFPDRYSEFDEETCALKKVSVLEYINLAVWINSGKVDARSTFSSRDASTLLTIDFLRQWNIPNAQKYWGEVVGARKARALSKLPNKLWENYGHSMDTAERREQFFNDMESVVKALTFHGL